MSQSIPRIERLDAVLARIGLSRSALYALQSQHDFPVALKLTARSVGFLSCEIDDWIDARVAARDGRVTK